MRILSTIFLLILLSACNKTDLKINSHFKKFILVGNYKDYKIANINRVKDDTLTIKKKKIIDNQIAINNFASEILILEDANERLKDDIKQISNAKIINISGRRFYQDNEDYSNYFKIMPRYLHGKKGDIEEKEKEIFNIGAQIEKLAKEKNKYILKIKLLKKMSEKNDSAILEISSQVVIKGINASGEDFHSYRVIQYKNGEIKKLTKIK